jgi:hypothetical protein
VLTDVLKLLLLYLRMAVRHLASRAPDQLEIAHRVISERAMRDPSVADSHIAVEKKLSAREAKRELKRKQKAAAAAAKAKGGSHHNAITTQIAQVYSSFQRARSHGAHAQQPLPPAPVTAAAAVSASGAAGAAAPASSVIAASSLPSVSVALPSLPAATAAVQRGESSVRLLGVDASPLSPASPDGGSARWDDGDDSSESDSEQEDSDGEMESDSAED